MGETVAPPLGRMAPPKRAWVGPAQASVAGGVSNVQGLGFNVLLGFLFMIFSRVFDMYLSSFHIPGISERLMALVVIVSGSFWRPFQTNVGKRLLWFTAWMVLGIPFSMWRSNSFTILTTQWWASLLVFVAVAGLIADFHQYRRAVLVLAVAVFALSLFCLHFGTLETGRLWMANRSRFANPNEMAQAILIGIPFWLGMTKRAQSPVSKLLAACVLLVMVYIISKTGSRGALISFAALYLVVLYHASAIGKAGLLLVGSLSLCVAIAFLPSALKDRYKTLFSQDKPEVEEVGEDALLVSAESSTASREHLFRQSLILTARHPIFGVGVGQFSVAENALAISQGLRKGSWLGTHNSYMEVACETGLVGLFFFVSVMVLSMKKAHALYNATKHNFALRDVSTQAEALFLSLLCLAITDLSIHASYTMLLPVLAGLTVSLEFTSRQRLADVQRGKAGAGLPAATVSHVLPRRRPPASPPAPADGLLSNA